MGGVPARPGTGRPGDERRAARDRRPHHRRRDFLQGRDARATTALEFTRPDAPAATPAAIAHAADLALAMGAPAPDARARSGGWPACLSDYPAKAGRTGYAVGLDTPAQRRRDRRTSRRPEGYRGRASRRTPPAMIGIPVRGRAARPVLTRRRLRAPAVRTARIVAGVREAFRRAWGDPARATRVRARMARSSASASSAPAAC